MGVGVETSETALRERIVWRGERFPIGVGISLVRRLVKGLPILLKSLVKQW